MQQVTQFASFDRCLLIQQNKGQLQSINNWRRMVVLSTDTQISKRSHILRYRWNRFVFTNRGCQFSGCLIPTQLSGYYHPSERKKLPLTPGWRRVGWVWVVRVSSHFTWEWENFTPLLKVISVIEQITGINKTTVIPNIRRMILSQKLHKFQYEILLTPFTHVWRLQCGLKWHNDGKPP